MGTGRSTYILPYESTKCINYDQFPCFRDGAVRVTKNNRVLGQLDRFQNAYMSHVFFWNEGTFLCGELMLTPRKRKHWYLQVRVGTRKHLAEASR